jgi:hypothetical protein
VKLVAVREGLEITARREAASPSPEREADFAAFEKSLPAPPAAPAEGVATAPTTSPGVEVSLGDLARQLRAERAAQGPPQTEITPPGSAAAAEGVPAGFKQVTFPSGAMTLSVPAQASDVQRTSEDVQLSAYLGTPTIDVGIDLTEVKVGNAQTPDDILHRALQQFVLDKA